MSIRKKVVFCKNNHKTNEKPHKTKTNPTSKHKSLCWFLLTFMDGKSIIPLYENMMGIATCNYPDTVPDCNGHSSAFDGVAYLPELTGSRDTCVLEADGAEGIFIAEFDLDMIRNYRKREVHGNAYRRPKMYGIITDTAKEDVFVREDYRE